MITESEFKMGGSCPHKVLHLRDGLPKNEDAFAAWMAAEAGRFRSAARHLFKDAVEISARAHDARVSETIERLAQGQTVFDATLATHDATCRCDVLKPDGPVLRLYQFVARPVDLERHRFGLEFTGSSGWLRREWRATFEQYAFRIHTVKALFPGYVVVPSIVVPVTGVPVEAEGLHAGFNGDSGKWSCDDATARAVEPLIRFIHVGDECASVAPAIAGKRDRLQAFLNAPTEPSIGYGCKKCEFRVAGVQSGFDRCWGPLAAVTPSMYDLGYMYFIQDENGKPVADRLARGGKVGLHDVPRDRITGEYADRQLMQLDGTLTNTEILKPELAEVLNSVTYPLICLDIETFRSWLPEHRGGTVNELILFQFSTHMREEPQGEFRHASWLNTEPSHPNQRFLTALRATLGDTGTVCVWTVYEESSFKELLTELIGKGGDEDDLLWLRRFLVSDRILDLHALCFKYHFHPLMKGRTSIKSVLPALWSVDSPVKRRMPYAEFPADTDPYATLKERGAIADGIMAMEGYLGQLAPAGPAKDASVAALEHYCYVDTLAMYYILDYWEWALEMQREP